MTTANVLREAIMTEKANLSEPDMQGWLLKWTNYVKGYQRRWFVLSNGLLSYYRNQAEMIHTCRGTISLHGASIHTEDSCTFVISNGGAQTFYIKASNEVERQTWVTALELAKAKAIQQIETDSTEESVGESAKVEVMTAIKVLSQKMEDLQMCNDLIVKHGNSLQKSLSELESSEAAGDVMTKIKAINERATLFRIASSTMINTCLEYLELAQSQGKKWQKMLQHEREQRIQLEEMVEQLAREQSALERVSKPSENADHISEHTSSEDENTEFYDAQGGEVTDSSAANYLEKRPRNATRHNSLSNTQVFDKIVSEELAADEGSSSDVDDMTESAAILTAAIRSSATIKNKKSRRDSGSNRLNDEREFPARRNETLLVLSENAKNALEEIKNRPWREGLPRRNRIPDKPHHPLHIWSIMKNCIGKDLSKIPMPVNFSEPLSMLQRLTEDFEYANVLDAAAKCEDPFERLAYIAAFTVSSYSTTTTRTGKPFNPLLGETYECDRFCDLGWRAISEQVSHHPPIAAQHCEGKNWTSWQEFTMSSKFRGKYLQLTPSGTSHLQFKDSDDHYTWCKVTTTVHNIIVGKLWVDQEGEMEIVNHKNGSKCRLTYVPYSYFARDQQRKVKGIVINKDGEAKWMINGTWDNKVEIAPVTKIDKDSGSGQTGSYISVWQRIVPPAGSEKYYNFTELACQLNEMEEGVAPTDSRLRPDQRLMELGMWDEANIEKLRLEEKQRQKRKVRNHQNEDSLENGDIHQAYEPLWFRKEVDKRTDVVESLCNIKADTDLRKQPNIMDAVKMGIDRKSHRLKEECLARKRNQEYRKQLFWNDITNYYKRWDLQAARYNVWSTQPTIPVSTEKCLQSYEKQLKERRIRLSHLLAEEFQKFKQEFQNKPTNVSNLKLDDGLPFAAENMKIINPESKLQKEEIRLREMQLRKFSQWKSSHPAISAMADKKFLQESMRKCWNEQLEEKQVQKERERNLVLKLEEENAKRLLLEEELAKEAFAKKREENKNLQSYLLMQMEEMKKKDELTQKIKLQEQQDIKLKRELELIAVRRNQMEKQRRSRELYSFLHNQYQLQLKQKTKKIQEELLEDQRFIEEVAKCVEQEDVKNCTIRQEARKQIDRANAMLCEFSRVEKQREKEMEFLFFEEAKNLWQKQESRWTAEQEARNNLMRDVLVTIQKQIKEKLEQNAQKHAKLIEEKERLLKNIESVNSHLKETDADLHSSREKYRQNLESQIREKQEKSLVGTEQQ